MHRSRSFRKSEKKSPKGRHVVHYSRRSNSLPHCAICSTELNGIAISASKGKTSRSNSRKFGGVLCSNCTGNVIKLASRIENGEMKMQSIGIKERAFVLQMISH